MIELYVFSFFVHISFSPVSFCSLVCIRMRNSEKNKKRKIKKVDNDHLRADSWGNTSPTYLYTPYFLHGTPIISDSM